MKAPGFISRSRASAKCACVAVTSCLLLLVTGKGRAEDANKAANPDITVTPSVQYVTVSGNQNQFRADQGMNTGWSGGPAATLHQDLPKDLTVDLSGSTVFNEQDYKLQLDITKKDVGYIRAGFSQYRQYYEGTGGYYAPFTPSSFTLPGNLHLDEGHIYVELGLTLPNLPTLTLGYERQYRDGEKSMLEWGGVTQGADTRKIFPSSKDIDEHTDIFKVGLEHDVKNIHFANQFQFEHYATDTKRSDTAVDLNTSTSQTTTINEQYSHDAFFNTFHMDSHLNEKVYWSVGYLYTTLDGNGGLNVSTPPPLTPSARNWMTQAMNVGSDSHVVNLSTMFGPFKGLFIYTGIQAEKTSNNGYTDALLTSGLSPTATNLVNSSNDKSSLEETIGLRYLKIPFTTLYAEARFTEQQLNLDELQTADGVSDLFLKTSTDVFRQDYRIGFNSSPTRRINISGSCRRYVAENDYDNNIDTAVGYPGFINMQDFTTDQAQAKLTVRATAKVSVSLQYQYITTDIRTGTDAIPTLPSVPKGTRTSGTYDSSIYSISTTVTPISRLYLTGLFSYQDTLTSAFDNQSSAVTAYKGNVYTAMGTAGYALDNKTDLSVAYSYSRCADYNNNNASTGLPLGLDNELQGLIVGVSRKISSNVVARFRYGWYSYNETSNGGITDYRTQVFNASCIVRF